MVEPKAFCELLEQFGLSFFCGVPDSLLKNLCTFVDATYSKEQHVITANEGNAVGLAAGCYLGSGKPAVVYMQNSGLGNAVNPLTSLADSAVYSIPMLLVIGWRGEPGVKDEPQHVKQGEISEEMLRVLGIPYVVLDGESKFFNPMQDLLSKMESQSRPVAVLVRKNTFAKPESTTMNSSAFTLSRERALESVLQQLHPNDLVVATTGKTSREVFEIRKKLGQPTNDFLTVGGMGHTSSIALGVAATCQSKRVICLDGDGSILMHMGALPIIADVRPRNLVHVLLNNQAHESVGGQPTVAGSIDFQQLAKAVGYQAYFCITEEGTLDNIWREAQDLAGPILMEIKISQGSREDLGRPTSTPIENKQLFMQHATDF